MAFIPNDEAQKNVGHAPPVFCRKTSIVEHIDDPTSEINEFLDPESKKTTSKSWYYSLSIEPSEIRRERVILFAEAYTIFGALFFVGVHALWEYSLYPENGTGNKILDRVLALSTALGFIANLNVTMFAAFLWLTSILFSGSSSNWVYSARGPLDLCFHLLVVILITTTVSTALCVYSHLRYHTVECVIALTFLGVTVIGGLYTESWLFAREIPLEYKKFPFWLKSFILPYPMMTKHGRDILRTGAKLRAEELKELASVEKSIIEISNKQNINDQNSVAKLLSLAASNIGRDGLNVTPYVVSLEREFYSEAEEMKNLSIELLSRFMPLRLAEETCRLLKLEGEVTT